MDLFGVTHKWIVGMGGGGAGGFLGPQPKICYTYPAMLKPGTLIPHLKKVKKS